MDIDNLTYGQIKEIAAMAHGRGNRSHPYKIGAAYHIRTVTHYYTGRLVAVYDRELVIEDAAWIPCDGRFANAMRDGTLDEIEPYPAGEVVIGRGAIIDASIWDHELPRDQK